MNDPLRTSWLVAVLLLILSALASAQTARSRVSVLLDSSGSMLLTPEFVTFPEACVALNWNGCTSSGNPSVAQEGCNACMAWVVRQSPTCASNFTTTCRTIYTNCWRGLTGVASGCGQSLNVIDGVSTRGDGSVLTPGCDVDADGQANDSRMFQAKESLRGMITANPQIEFALWRYRQIAGGQACLSDAECPDTPGGQSLLSCENVNGSNRCMLDAGSIGSAAGQCAQLTWNGADMNFSCAQCVDNGERLLCDSLALAAIRDGGTSPLLGTVNCALPTTDHAFLANHGAISSGGSCDPNGGQRLVDFPANGAEDNRPAISAWIDHQQPNLAIDVEVSANGLAPMAASLRDLRSAIFASAQADVRTPCRRHAAILVTDSSESCETLDAAITAAGTFQNMSYTNAAGTVVNDYDVPLYVVGFGICPPSTPNCQAIQDLQLIAAAAGTGSALLANNQVELDLVLAQIAQSIPQCSAPTLAKHFAPNAIVLGGISTLSFSIDNANVFSSLHGVAFTDAFPAGLEVAAIPNATTTGCGTPTFTATAGSVSLGFSNGTIAASGSCTASVDVVATSGGDKENITVPVSSTDGGIGNSGSDTLQVSAPVGIFSDGFEA